MPPPLIGCVCLCSYVESSSPMTTIPPATFATRNLTTANKTSTAAAAAAAAAAADDNVKGNDDGNDDGWMESRPDDSTYNYPSTPAQSYSTSQGYVCTTD